jgi:predicted nucleotidyltransferase
MIPVVTDRFKDLQELCRRHRVTRLAVFGSAVTGEFSPESSDLDFVVDFAEMDPVDHADCYLGLLLDLERLFGRRIDLIEERAIRNPFFRQGVDSSRHVLYGA